MPKNIKTPEDKIEELEKRIALLEKNGTKKPKVKRQPSAFNIFMKDAIVHIKKDNPDVPHNEAFKMAAAMWQNEKA
jgi:hypothetical protein